MVLLESALAPLAVFWLPVVFWESAATPLAVFRLPFVFWRAHISVGRVLVPVVLLRAQHNRWPCSQRWLCC